MAGHRRWGRSALGAIVAIVWLATGATAQSPGRPTDLVGSLLTTEDLPPGLVSQGIDEPPRFDIDDASFQALGGLRAVGQVWQRAGGTPLIVFDHRMAFPDADAAAAYLDAAEPILSEAAASGLTPVVSDDPVGEHGRHYAGETVAGDTTVQLHNFLFHVGPVAAKVFVGGVDLPAGLPAEVAAAAASRMETAAGGPSPAAPAPSDAASPAPSEASGPIGDVLAHVPASVRATCDEADRSGSEVAVVASTPPDGPAVLYALYDNGIAVDGDFTSITATLPTPRATTCAEGPFLGTYAVGGEVVGQLACWTADDTPYLVASDKRIPMIVLLLGREGGTAALEEALTRLAPTP